MLSWKEVHYVLSEAISVLYLALHLFISSGHYTKYTPMGWVWFTSTVLCGHFKQERMKKHKNGSIIERVCI